MAAEDSGGAVRVTTREVFDSVQRLERIVSEGISELRTGMQLLTVEQRHQRDTHTAEIAALRKSLDDHETRIRTTDNKIKFWSGGLAVLAIAAGPLLKALGVL